MVKTDIKLSPSKPFVWYQEYHYYGMDPENFHTHPTWQLTIVTEGELCFTFAGGDKHYLRGGNLMLIAPGTLHEGHCSGTNAHSLQMFFRYFDNETMPEVCLCIDSFQMNKVWFASAAPERCDERANMIRKKCEPSAPFSRSWMTPLLSLLFMEGITPFLNQFPKNDRHPPENIVKVIQYIHHHFTSDIGVKELAEMAELSPSRFSAVFFYHLKISPKRFLNRLRLTFAQELLLNHVPVRETARRAGFSSPQYFCRYFHQETGQTPAEFSISPVIYKSI